MTIAMYPGAEPVEESVTFSVFDDEERIRSARYRQGLGDVVE